MPRTKAIWSVAEAKAHLSELLETALRDGPQTITKNGRSTAVIVSAEEWAKKSTRKGSLAEFLLASPLRDAGLDLSRSTDDPRALDL